MNTVVVRLCSNMFFILCLCACTAKNISRTTEIVQTQELAAEFKSTEQSTLMTQQEIIITKKIGKLSDICLMNTGQTLIQLISAFNAADQTTIKNLLSIDFDNLLILNTHSGKAAPNNFTELKNTPEITDYFQSRLIHNQKIFPHTLFLQTSNSPIFFRAFATVMANDLLKDDPKTRIVQGTLYCTDGIVKFKNISFVFDPGFAGSEASCSISPTAFIKNKLFVCEF